MKQEKKEAIQLLADIATVMRYHEDMPKRDEAHKEYDEMDYHSKIGISNLFKEWQKILWGIGDGDYD